MCVYVYVISLSRIGAAPQRCRDLWHLKAKTQEAAMMMGPRWEEITSGWVCSFFSPLSPWGKWCDFNGGKKVLVVLWSNIYGDGNRKGPNSWSSQLWCWNWRWNKQNAVCNLGICVYTEQTLLGCFSRAFRQTQNSLSEEIHVLLRKCVHSGSI